MVDNEIEFGIDIVMILVLVGITNLSKDSVLFGIIKRPPFVYGTPSDAVTVDSTVALVRHGKSRLCGNIIGKTATTKWNVDI